MDLGYNITIVTRVCYLKVIGQLFSDMKMSSKFIIQNAFFRNISHDSISFGNIKNLFDIIR